jgi:hypothetical protein
MAKINFTTPEGVAVYPYISKADYQYTPEGVYKTKLKMSAKDAAPLIKTIEQTAADELGSRAKTARMPFTKLEDTNEVEFLTKSKFKPKVFNGNGEVIAEQDVPPIYGGSVLKAAGVVSPYDKNGNVGISLQLSGVQIIQLSESSSAASVSFGAVEGGFVPAANDNAGEASDGASYNF